jgi:hypothetical protein
MDINKIAGLNQPTKLTKHRTNKNDETFARVLDKAVHRGCDSTNPAGKSLPAEGIVGSTACVSAISGDHVAITRASHMLDLLETYAKALGDPHRTLKSIEPMVHQIHDELQELKANMPAKDAGLVKLVDDIAVTATVETLKFQRGDYVP